LKPQKAGNTSGLARMLHQSTLKSEFCAGITDLNVIPAQAKIRESRHPEKNWTPAYAGVTKIFASALSQYHCPYTSFFPASRNTALIHIKPDCP